MLVKSVGSTFWEVKNSDMYSVCVCVCVCVCGHVYLFVCDCVT